MLAAQSGITCIYPLVRGVGGPWCVPLCHLFGAHAGRPVRHHVYLPPGPRGRYTWWLLLAVGYPRFCGIPGRWATSH